MYYPNDGVESFGVAALLDLCFVHQELDTLRRIGTLAPFVLWMSIVATSPMCHVHAADAVSKLLANDGNREEVYFTEVTSQLG